MSTYIIAELAAAICLKLGYDAEATELQPAHAADAPQFGLQFRQAAAQVTRAYAGPQLDALSAMVQDELQTAGDDLERLGVAIVTAVRCGLVQYNPLCRTLRGDTRSCSLKSLVSPVDMARLYGLDEELFEFPQPPQAVQLLMRMIELAQAQLPGTDEEGNISIGALAGWAHDELALLS